MSSTFSSISYSEATSYGIKLQMSFFEFKVNSHSTLVDSYRSPAALTQESDLTPGQTNPSGLATNPIRVATPAPISTLHPAVPNTFGSISRTRLEPGDQLVLARLCVLNQSDYAEGKKGEFWSKISLLLEQDTGKRLKDPASTMKLLVAGRRIKRDAESLESGTTQPDTELTQALDAWIVRLDTVEQEKSANKKSTADMVRETVEAEWYRENLLKPQGQKKKRGESEKQDEKDMEIGLMNQKRKKRFKRSVGEEQREKEIDAIHKDTALLVSAVQDMGTQMAGAIRYLGSNSASESTNDTNVIKLEDRLSLLEKQGEEQKEQGRRQEDINYLNSNILSPKYLSSSIYRLSDSLYLQSTTTMAKVPKGTKLKFEMSRKLKSHSVKAVQNRASVLVENIFKRFQTLPNASSSPKGAGKEYQEREYKDFGYTKENSGVCH
ncbi:hypothetical protein B9Z19DRAFT_1127655 [Tuber borchii]|uniref:Uncharacterized protein n=1 Tax=Tuber borchii TaxID=42251 RepID=A0A2T6ZQX7_TUBBO|nr:hypothetical protein B9Z19DRAFT_1127655 [Tuber borchii]